MINGRNSMRYEAFILIFLGLTSCFACAHFVEVPLDRRDGIAISFSVANSTSGYPISSADVYLVSQTGGQELLGTTKDGILVVPKEELDRPDAIVVLFCHREFFCGALRVNEEEVLRHDEFLFELAPFALN